MMRPSHLYHTGETTGITDIERAAHQNAHRTGRPVTIHFHFRSRKSRKGNEKFISCRSKGCYSVFKASTWPPGQELFVEVMKEVE